MTIPNLIAGAISGGLNSLQGKHLETAQIGSGDTAVYTVPANSAVRIATASLCNTTGSAVTISVSVVPSGGSADGTHKVIANYSLAGYDTISQEDVLAMLKGLLMEPGDFINVNASTATAVDCVLTGFLIS